MAAAVDVALLIVAPVAVNAEELIINIDGIVCNLWLIE